ncbi:MULTISPECIES: transposase [Kitasatospora]|uniref:Transposase IS701-like DDE domain-containing protein n=1 Tax=Kitasatospora cystarginea TaxID=58350 RepID=A0ABN3EZQ0_9ACTN
MTRRTDALLEVADALLCTDGPVRALVELALAPEHQPSHGSLYAALNRGSPDQARLRTAIAARNLPRGPGGRIVLTVDVSPWLWPDASRSDARSFCHTYGRRENTHEMVPGWPYSFVAALESGSTSWTALLDAKRLEPGTDTAAVTSRQLREALRFIINAGHWTAGDPPVLVVADAGHDGPRLTHLLRDLPAQIVVRTRSDRVFFHPVPDSYREGPKGSQPPAPRRPVHPRRPRHLVQGRQQFRTRHPPPRPPCVASAPCVARRGRTAGPGKPSWPVWSR